MAIKRTWAKALKPQPLSLPDEPAGVCKCGENRYFHLRVQSGEMKRICLRCKEELKV